MIIAPFYLSSQKNVDLGKTFFAIELVLITITATLKVKNAKKTNDDELDADIPSPSLYNVSQLMTKIDSLTEYRDKSNAGITFERIICIILKANGFTDIQTTAASGDFGIDIFATVNGKKYAIQCKCYQSDVSNKAIQEVFTGMAMYKCDYAAVITNRFFTKSAKETANAIKVILWDRNALINMASKVSQEDLKQIIFEE